MDVEVANKFQQVGEFASAASANIKCWLYVKGIRTLMYQT